MTKWHNISRLICLAALLFAAGTAMFMGSAYAAEGDRPAPVPHGTCTTDPQFQPSELEGAGLIGTMVSQVEGILAEMQKSLFKGIVKDNAFTETLRAAITLYIAFYGIMFTLGIVNMTLYDFTVRMAKLGVVAYLFSEDAWTLFNDTFVKFFNEGTKEWIEAVAQAAASAMGGSGAGTPNGAFGVIDQALSKAVSAKAVVTVMAMSFTPPYGPVLVGLLILATSTFVRALLQASWVYLMSLIIKSLLLGLGPIFIACMLFNYTHYLFTGWLNQLINASLQPIMLFTFLAFFVGLIDAALGSLYEHPVCWTEWNESLRGTPFSWHFWRMALCEGDECFPYGGKWDFIGPQAAGMENAPVFPVPILGILVLVVLSDLCARFNNVVITISSELAGASINLAQMGGALSQWFDKGGGGGGSGLGGGTPPKPATLPNERPESATAKFKEQSEGMMARRDIDTPKNMG